MGKPQKKVCRKLSVYSSFGNEQEKNVGCSQIHIFFVLHEKLLMIDMGLMFAQIGNDDQSN
jgi:hypothetical protein